MVNTNKLKGRIVEHGFNITTFAEALNLSRPAARRKINGSVPFNADEIKKTISLLDLSHEDLDLIFFA